MLEQHDVIVLIAISTTLLLLAYCVARLWRQVRNLQSKGRSLQQDLANLEKI